MEIKQQKIYLKVRVLSQLSFPRREEEELSRQPRNSGTEGDHFPSPTGHITYAA